MRIGLTLKLMNNSARFPLERLNGKRYMFLVSMDGNILFRNFEAPDEDLN